MNLKEQINYNQLLNRKPISTNVESIKGFIKGKRILITGGAGSIGSEIVRQLVNFGAGVTTQHALHSAQAYRETLRVAEDNKHARRRQLQSC